MLTDKIKLNSGGIDRIIRIAADLALLAWAGILNGPVWAFIGILPLATGIIGSLSHTWN